LDLQIWIEELGAGDRQDNGSAVSATAPTSAMWWDVSSAPSPAQAAVPLLDLALGPVKPGHYGELVRDGEVLPWSPLD
jgi:hypothetical protein